MSRTSLKSLLDDEAVMSELQGGQVEVVEAPTESLDVILAADAPLSAGGTMTELEAIVLLTGRPALLVQGGRWAAPKIAEIAKRLAPWQSALERAIASVGRLEIVDHHSDYVGTGWMVEGNVLVTNRHVAELFAERGAAACTFRRDAAGATLSVRVDFLREHQRADMHRVQAAEVLFIEEAGDLHADLALVRLERGSNGLPPPIELDESTPQLREAVAVIGYPAEDPRNDAFARRKLFEGIFGVKRLSPGQICGVPAGEVFVHDCTTLGGSSGSVVMSLSTGKACGLHFAGSYRESNCAVTAAALRERLARIGPTLVQVPQGPVAVAGAQKD